MAEELGLVCLAPLSVLTRQQNADEASALSIVSIPLRHDRPLVDGTPCLRESGHDRPSGGPDTSPSWAEGAGGRVDAPPDDCGSLSLKHQESEESFGMGQNATRGIKESHTQGSDGRMRTMTVFGSPVAEAQS